MLELLKHPFDKKIGNYSFSFEASIGTGSFSTVYLGADPEGNPFAVKVIDKKKINHEYYAGLLNNEIKSMKKLVHKNIVRLFEVLHTNNNFYIVTEFCEGGDLSKILETRKYLPPNEALNIFRDLLEGFKEMNAHCIMHRDIKPPNIYISGGVYKIGDFGFAKVVSHIYEEIRTPLIGTPLYTPPQCLQEYPYSSKCDIWSLAIVLYEMLFGRTPWNANNHLELIMKYYQQPLMIPEKADVPDFCYDFLNRAIVINEAQRISWEEIFSHLIYSSEQSKTLRIQFSNIENTVKVPSPTEILQKSFTRLESKSALTKAVSQEYPRDHRTGEMESLVETVKKQVEFLSTQNIVSPITLEKLKFLICKHRYQFSSQNDDCKKELEALFYVLSCNSVFTAEANADPFFTPAFNTNPQEKELREALKSSLRYEIRELNHELHFQNQNAMQASLVNCLALLCHYYEALDNGVSNENQKNPELRNLQAKIYYENL